MCSDFAPAQERIYLDHAASAPLASVAVDAMVRASAVVGNSSALHASGRAARAALEDSRERLAAALGAHPTELLFTSGGSEADSLAIWAGLRRTGRRGVLVGATEHAAVAGAKARFADVEVLRSDRDGLLDLTDAGSRVGQRTALVSVMRVNNETGTVQDLAALSELCRGRGVWLHTDAVQALGHLELDFHTSGADLMSLSAHKVGGPVGIGCLLARREVELQPYGLGGGQEREVRSGTQPVLLAAAFAAVAEQAVAQQQAEHARLEGLRTRLVERIRATITQAWVNGAEQVSPAICNVTFEDTRADDVLMLLDQAGVDCSTGSACRAGVHQPSEVLLAMGRSLEQASASIRFSFGAGTTMAQVDHVAGLLPDVVSRARAAYAAG